MSSSNSEESSPNAPHTSPRTLPYERMVRLNGPSTTPLEPDWRAPREPPLWFCCWRGAMPRNSSSLFLALFKYSVFTLFDRLRTARDSDTHRRRLVQRLGTTASLGIVDMMLQIGGEASSGQGSLRKPRRLRNLERDIQKALERQQPRYYQGMVASSRDMN